MLVVLISADRCVDAVNFLSYRYCDYGRDPPPSDVSIVIGDCECGDEIEF